MKYQVKFIIMILIFYFSDHCFAKNEETDWEKLFNNDFEEKALQVNEGKLEFLPNQPTDKKTHSIINTITISQESVKHGWVSFRQCHNDLDPVGQAQIVYKYKQMRNLRIDRFDKIEKAWIENQSIQLEEIQKDSTVCVHAEARIFMRNPEGHFLIRNGPYFRKFLDGYYPFHVTLNINYADTNLSINNISHKIQPGFEVKKNENELIIDAWFEGELMVDITFNEK